MTSLALAWLIGTAPVVGQEWVMTQVASLFPSGSAVTVNVLVGSRTPAKTSPLHNWRFDRMATCSVRASGRDSDRFRVYGQSGAPATGLLQPQATARYLAGLYDFARNGLNLDHSPLQNQRVDVYLCNEGTAGGEQALGEDTDTADGQPENVNMVYVYEVPTLANRLEACRELAHEYGHALLPGVKVPGAHEEWANGDLGERLFLLWLRQGLVSGALTKDDAFGVEVSALDNYVSARVDKFVANLAKSGPSLKTLRSVSQAAEDHYLAVACLTFHAFPLSVLKRSLVLNRDQSPIGYLSALGEAVEERDEVEVKPVLAADGTGWIPIGKSKVSGAKVLERRDGWARVQPTGPVRLLGTQKG